MPSALYMIQRPSGFYLRIAVPPEFRAVFGLREFVRPVRAKDRREAARRCRRIGAALRAAFDNARRMSELPSFSLGQFRSWVLDYLMTELDRFDTEAASFTAADRANFDAYSDAVLDSLVDPTEPDDPPPATVRPTEESDAFALAILQPRGLHLDAAPAKLRQAIRVEAARALTDLIAMQAEAAQKPVSRPVRAEVLSEWRSLAAERFAVPSPASPILAADAGPLPVAVMRQLRGLDLEAGQWSVSQLFAEFLKAAAKRWKDGPEHAEKRRYGPVRDVWISLIGDIPVANLEPSHVRRFVEHIKAEGERKGSAPKTIAKHLDNLRAVLKWAQTKLIVSGLTAPLDGEEKPKSKSYQPFTEAEQRTIFEAQPYRSHLFNRPAKFWLPLLGLTTGARIEELAALTVTQVEARDGIPGLMLSPDGIQTGKNEHSRRWVPLHPLMVEAGFPQFVETVRAEGHDDLFPDLGKGGDRDGKGKSASRDFMEFRRALGIGAEEKQGRSTKVFHSFRTTLIGALKVGGVDGDLRRALVGHAPTDTHEETYGGQTDFPPVLKLDAISRARFAFNTPRWADQPHYRDARAKGCASRSIERAW